MFKSTLYSEERRLIIVFGFLFIIGCFAIVTKEMKDAFYTYILLSSSFVAVAFLSMVDYTIYPFEQRKGISNKQKTGSIYLSYAMLTWALLGLTYIIVEWCNRNPHINIKSVEPIFSTINSCFLILGMHDLFFQKEPNWKWPRLVDWLRSSDALRKIVIPVILLELLLSYYSFYIKDTKFKFANYPDLLFSSIAVSYLGVVMFAIFRERKMPMMKWLVVVSLVVTFMGQVLKSGTSINIDITAVRYFYISSLQILIFGLVISYNYVKSLIRAENQINDMNHAIRNGLLLLRLDIQNAKPEPIEILTRVRALEDLHDLLHKQRNTSLGFPLKDYYYNIFTSFLSSQNLSSNQLDFKVYISNKIYSAGFEKIRETGRLIIELNLNALKYSRINNFPVIISNKINIVDDFIEIVVEDCGPGFEFNPHKEYTGFGIKNILAILSNLKGRITFEKNTKSSSGTVVTVKIFKLELKIFEHESINIGRQ